MFKVLVVLAVAGACVAVPYQFISDTPEVAAEKQRFFQLYNAAAAAAAAAPDDYAVPRQVATSSYRHSSVHNPQWNGPFASAVPAGVNGNFGPVQETPEVAAARRDFERAYQQQLNAVSSGSRSHSGVSHGSSQVYSTPSRDVSHSSGSHSQFSHQPAQVYSVPSHRDQFSHSSNSFLSSPSFNEVWTGPVAATIPAGLPGSVSQVPNTPEVEAAIADFTRAYNSELQNTVGRRRHQASSFGSSFHGGPSIGSSYPGQVYEAPQPKWTGPLAATIPAGLPGSVSQVQDTPEVAAAKAQFQRAFQRELVYRG